MAEMTEIRGWLLALRDEPYAVFQRRLIPSLPPERIVGVRTPALRALAMELHGSAEADAFLAELPHTYFEENNLHGFLLEYIRDFEPCIAARPRRKRSSKSRKRCCPMCATGLPIRTRTRSATASKP